ncbi:uncharacterized protein METZ01_LOCUS390585, partial [marine metagenome]
MEFPHIAFVQFHQSFVGFTHLTSGNCFTIGSIADSFKLIEICNFQSGAYVGDTMYPKIFHRFEISFSKAQ